MKRELDIVRGSIPKNLLWFSIPIMLTGLLQTLYNAADVVVVGQFAGSHSLAAVGSTGSLVNLLICLLTGLSSGASVCVAQYVGAEDQEGVRGSVHTSIGTALAGGLLLAVIGVLIARPVLRLMEMPEEVLDEASLYMKILFLGMPANLIYNFGSGILRSFGDSKHPMIFLAISGLLNVLLNLFFVIVLGMGAGGVATATVVSQVVSAAMVLYFLAKKTPICKLYLRKIRIQRRYFIRIAQIGIPAGIQSAVFSLSNVLIQSSINSFGTAAIAGNAASSNLEGFSYISMNAMFQAMITFVGQNVGAGRQERIKPIVRFGCMYVVLVWLVMSGGTLLFLHPLLGLYAPGNEEVISIAAERSWYILSCYFLCGVMEVYSGAQRGMGRSFAPMLGAILSVCGIRIVWIYTVFTYMHTLESLYFSYIVSWIVNVGIQMVLYQRARRK